MITIIWHVYELSVFPKSRLKIIAYALDQKHLLLSEMQMARSNSQINVYGGLELFLDIFNPLPIIILIVY